MEDQNLDGGSASERGPPPQVLDSTEEIERVSRCLAGDETAQQELVNMVMELTQCGNDRAKQVLRMCTWNLEEAVQLQFEAVEDSGPRQRRPQVDSSRTSQGNEARQEPPDIVVRDGGSPILRIVTALLLPIWIVFCNAWSFIRILFSFARSLLRFRNTVNLMEAYESRFGHSHPALETVTLSEAATNSRRREKGLLVLIYSDNQPSQELCRNVLVLPHIVQNIEEDFLFWAAPWNCSQGAEACRALGVRSWPPTLAVVSPVGSNEVTVHASGNLGVNDFLSFMVAGKADIRSRYDQVRARLIQHEENRLLRQEQDREYAEALEHDRKMAAERAKKEEEARKAEEMKNAELKAKEDEILQRQAAQRAIEEQRSVLAQEFRKEGEISSFDRDRHVKIRVRLPSGDLLERIFDRDQKLQRVEDWIGCSGELYDDRSARVEVPLKFSLTAPRAPPSMLSDSQKRLSEIGLESDTLSLYLNKSD